MVCSSRLEMVELTDAEGAGVMVVVVVVAQLDLPLAFSLTSALRLLDAWMSL